MIKQIYNNILYYYNKVLNKIAVRSQVYQSLYGEVESHKKIFENLDEMSFKLQQLKSFEILLKLLNNDKLGNLNLFEQELLRISNEEYLIIVDSPEKYNQLQNFVKGFSHKPQIKFLNEINDDMLHRHNGPIYIPIRNWTQDLFEVYNLMYDIRKNNKEYKL